ncbi:glycosyltransferase family 4 protein [Clostridium tyrobutyricum]|uniref:glycosyltransferase family 4 protein n=1 Tax=Clostridium tyrobutyricum TaxID=1519 RepID=UPI0039F67E42
MRVLFISHEDADFGAPKAMFELILNLKNNYDVEPIVLLHSDDNIKKLCDKVEIENYVVGHRNCISKKNRSIKGYIHFCLKKIVYNLSRIIALHRIKKNIDMKSIDIIHTNVSIIDLGIDLHKIYGIPNILHLREPGTIINEYKFCRKRYIELINKNCICNIAISNAIKEQWIENGIRESNIKVIYDGVNIPKMPITKFRYTDKKVHIVMCGSISKQKGQHQLIEAVRLLPINYKNLLKIHFIGKGDKKYINKIKSNIVSYKLNDIFIFEGYKKNISEILPYFDIGVSCSKFEPFGRVTVEYMLAKLCVIASNTGASPEIIDDNQNGFLYRYNNYKDLAQKIRYVIDNKNLKINIGNLARKKVIDNFSMDIHSRNIYRLYERILNEGVYNETRI